MLVEGNSKPRRVAVYCRVSSEEQAHNGTIQNQIDFARRYCDLHNLEIAEVYSDDGVSGTIDPALRPASVRMLADAKAKQFDSILVYRLDRLSRSLWHLLNLYQRLDGGDVSICSMTEPLDTSSPVGRFVFQLLGSIAELERETIRERTELGRGRALATGKAMGMASYGYMVDKEGMLIINPQETTVVRELFDLALKGVSSRSIAQLLNERGTPTLYSSRGYDTNRPSKQGWQSGTILQILHNPIYWTGELRYQRKDGSFSVLPAPAIVEPSTAILVHQTLANNNTFAKGPHRIYLLAGLIRCGDDCGATWSGSGTSRTGRSYYSCSNSKRPQNGKKCDKRIMRADLLDAEVWRDIRTVAENPGTLAERITTKLSARAGDVEAARKALASAVSEYNALVAKRLDAQFRFDSGDITAEELSSYLRAGAGRVRELERLKIELSQHVASCQVQEAKAASLEWVCQHLREMVAEAENDDKLKQQLVRSLVNQVLMTTGEDGRTVANVEYVFADPRSPEDPTITQESSALPIEISPRYPRPRPH